MADELQWLGQTKVQLFENIPLDNTYSDVIVFDSVGSQNGYFEGKTKYNSTLHSYQRVNNSVRNPNAFSNPRREYTCRVDGVADRYYKCNYMRFQNQAPSETHKWFYCFIRKINYINPNCTEIVYEIDYFQTYFFDMTINASFIKRETTETDEFFEHLLLEPIVPNTYYIANKATVNANGQLSGSPSVYYTFMLAPFKNISEIPCGLYGSVIGGVINPYYILSTNLSNLITQTIDAIVATEGGTDALVAIQLSSFETSTSANETRSFNITGMKTNNDTLNFNGESYKIRNKKLCNYPYHYFEFGVKNNSITCMPQFFTNDDITGEIKVNHSLSPNAIVRLTGYKVTGEYTNEIEWNDNVLLPFTENAYSTYMAQNKNSTALSILGDTAGIVGGVGAMVLGAYTMNPALGMVGSTLAGNSGRRLLSTNAQLMDLKQQPEINHGSYNSETNYFGQQKNKIYVNEYFGNIDFIKSADNYFDRFGYNVSYIGVPKLANSARPYWKYIQTENISISGSMPVEAMATIKAIFNNGVTCWKSSATVGDYSQDNRV